MVGQPNQLRNLKKGAAKVHSLIVGINNYDDPELHPLHYATRDCDDLANALRSALSQFPSQEFPRIHHDNTPDQPNLITVKNSLHHLARNAKPQDTLFFHFSGHGRVDTNTQDLYLCLKGTRLSDLTNTALSVKELLATFQSSKACNIVIIFDACRTGATPRGRGIPIARGGVGVMSRSTTPGNTSESEPSDSGDVGFVKSLDSLLGDYSIDRKELCVIYSCKEGQSSWELSGHIQHGAFTHCLIRGLQGEAAEGEKITVEALFKFVRDETNKLVSEFHEYQTPGWKREPYHYDIILGMRSPDILKPPPPSAKFAELADWYRNEYELLIRKQGIYISSEISADALRERRNASRLTPEDRQVIEHQINQHYRDRLNRLNQYKSRLNRMVRTHGIPSHEALMRIRDELNLNDAGFEETAYELIEQDVFQEIHGQYKQAYSKALRRCGLSLDNRANRELFILQTQLNLDNAAYRRHAQEEKDRFIRDWNVLKAWISQELRQTDGFLSEESLQKQNETYQFSFELLKQLVQQEQAVFKQQRDELSQKIAEALHQVGYFGESGDV
jgi:hypothetical protein